MRIGNDLVLTGYIDSWEPAITRARHEVQANGRSKCQDLVDCSAEWPNNVINRSNALDIASRLASWYDIKVSSDVEDLVEVPQFTINWGNRHRKSSSEYPGGRHYFITICPTVTCCLPAQEPGGRPAECQKGRTLSRRTTAPICRNDSLIMSAFR